MGPAAAVVSLLDWNFPRVAASTSGGAGEKFLQVLIRSMKLPSTVCHKDFLHVAGYFIKLAGSVSPLKKDLLLLLRVSP